MVEIPQEAPAPCTKASMFASKRHRSAGAGSAAITMENCGLLKPMAFQAAVRNYFET